MATKRWMHQHWRLVVGLASCLALLLLLWSIWDREAVVEWMGRARPLPFFAVMAIASSVGLPPTPFLLVAGATFGPRLGLFGSILAIAANLALCYWLARLMRPVLVKLLRRFGHELPSLGAKERNATRFTLAVKLAPGVPAFVKNYGLVLAGVPFSTYFAWSFLITGLYAAALIVLGDSLFEHDRGRASLSLGLLGVLALGIWWWRRRSGRDVEGPPRLA